MASLFDALFRQAQGALAPVASAPITPIPKTLTELVATPEWQRASLEVRRQLYDRWRKEVAAPVLKAQAAADKKADTDFAAQAQNNLRDFERREFRPAEGGLFNNDLLDQAAAGLASAVGGAAQAIGTATGSKRLFDFGRSAQADADRIAQASFSDATFEKQTKAGERTVASRRDQLLADAAHPLNAKLLELGRRWGGVDKIPVSSPDLKALTDEYDRTGGTSVLPEVTTAVRNVVAAPLDTLARAAGSSAPILAGGMIGGVPGAMAAGAAIGAGQGAEAYDRVMTLTDAQIMAQPAFAEQVTRLGGGPDAIAAVRRAAAETASNKAAAMNAAIGAVGAGVGARFGAESAVTRGAAPGAAGSFVGKTATEVAQEGTEGALNQATTNLAVQGADPTQALSAGVAPAAVEEALAGGGMSAALHPFAPTPVAPPPGLTQEQLAAAAEEAAARERRAQTTRDNNLLMALEQAAAPTQPTMAAPVDNVLRPPAPSGPLGLPAPEVPLALPAPYVAPPPAPNALAVTPQGEALTPDMQLARELDQLAPELAGGAVNAPVVPMAGLTGLTGEEVLGLLDTGPFFSVTPTPAPSVGRAARTRAFEAPLTRPAVTDDPLSGLLSSVGLPTVEAVDANAMQLLADLRSREAALAIQQQRLAVLEAADMLPPRAAARLRASLPPGQDAWSARQREAFYAAFDPNQLTDGARAAAAEGAPRILNDPDAHPEFRSLLVPLTVGSGSGRAGDGGDAVSQRGGQPAADPAGTGGGGAGADAGLQRTAGGQAGAVGAQPTGSGETAAAGLGRAAAGQAATPQQRGDAGGAAQAGDGGAAPAAVPQGSAGGADAGPAGTDGRSGGQGAAFGDAGGAGRAAQAGDAGGPGRPSGGPEAGAGAARPALAPLTKAEATSLTRARRRVAEAEAAVAAAERDVERGRERSGRLGRNNALTAARQEQTAAREALARTEQTVATDRRNRAAAPGERMRAAAMAGTPFMQEDPADRRPRDNTVYQTEAVDGVALSRPAVTALENNDLGTALQDLAKTGSSPMVRAVAARLAPLLTGVTQVRLQPGLTRPDGVTVFGGASVDGTVIVLNPDMGLAEETLLHEAVHAATERVLRAKDADMTPAQREARAELAKLWRAAQADPTVRARMSEESIASLSEFVAEAMTNMPLQAALDSKPYQLGSAWARFKRVVLDLLGLGPRDTLLGASVAAIDTLFTRPATIIREGAPNAADQGNQSQGVRGQRANGNQGRQTAEAGRGNRVLGAGARAEGAGQDAAEARSLIDLLYQAAFHGTPYRGIEKFSTDKIGTGEGAQAYGWGLYFASKRGVAEHYREMLSNRDAKGYSDAHLNAQRQVERFNGDPEWAAEVVKEQRDLLQPGDENYQRLDQTLKLIESGDYAKPLPPKGQLYEVEIPEDSEMLLWDKPLSEQPAKVREALVKAIPQLQAEVDRRNAEREALNAANPGRLTHPVVGKVASKVATVDGIKGQTAYETLSRAAGSDKAASEALMAVGIKGIKYLDGASRGNGAGTFNFVIFSGDDVQITEQLYASSIGERGTFDPSKPDMLYATNIGASVGAAVRQMMSRGDRVRSESDFLDAGAGPQGPRRPVSLTSIGDRMVAAFVDHSVEATNLIDAEAAEEPTLAPLWQRVKDAMITWRNRSDAFFETHRGQLVDPYYERLAALARRTGMTTEQLHREAGAVAQARHALDRMSYVESEMDDAIARAQERVDQFDAMEAALRDGTRDKVGALVGRLRAAADDGISPEMADALITESLQVVSDMALALEQAQVKVPRTLDLLRGLDAMAVREARGRNAVDAVVMVLSTLDKVNAIVARRGVADRVLQEAKAKRQNYDLAQSTPPVIERAPDGSVLEKLAAPLPGGLRREVAQQKLDNASAAALELADLTRDLFRRLTDLAVENGALSPHEAEFYQRRFPNYVSFMGDSVRDVDDMVGLSPNRGFLEEAEGAQTVGQPAPPIVNLIAKLHQLGNVVGSADMRRALLDIALTDRSALVKMAEGLGEKGSARLNVFSEVSGVRVKARIALMDDRLADGMMRTKLLESKAGQAIGRATGMFGRLVTQFVPAFAPINMVRDAMTRAFNFVGRQELRPAQVNAARASFFAHLASPDNWAEVWHFVRTGEPTGNMLALRDAGGLLLFTDSQVSETKVETEVGRLNATAMAAVRRGGARVLKVVEQYNRLFEAIIPLATFRALRAVGLTDAQAAAVTTDMMNFRARGTLTPAFNAAYPFFAAAAQDARQVARTLMPNGRPNVRAWTEMLVLAGIAATLYAMAREGDDDDEFGGKAMDALTTDHERNWVVPVGDGTYAKIPVGFGIVQLAWNLGVNAMRVSAGIMSAEDAALGLGKAFVKALAPTGVSEIDFGKDPTGALLLTFMPGLAKPIAQVAANKNFAGGKITYAEPGEQYLSEQGRAATPEVYKQMASTWRELTGLDLAPEQVRTLVEGYLVGPFTALTAAADDRAEKGLSPRGFGSDAENALAKAVGANRLLRPVSPEQELATKAFARIEEAKAIMRRMNAEVPKEVEREDIDMVLGRASQAGATAAELGLLAAFLEYKREDGRIRRAQGKLRSAAALGEFEQQRLAAMREFLLSAAAH